jgi:putative hydroxymethylpyrimidine transport system permease protein
LSNPRPLLVLVGLLLLWQALVWITGVPRYLLPPPWLVAKTLVREAPLPPLQPWLLPLLVLGQTIPVFALAPLLVLWFGYGLASKVVMATLIIYFPVAAALFDGLRRTEPGWLDLARTMGATRLRTLLRVRLPAALPALGSGVRVATAVAPIGAVVGEWVGSSAGLGYLMLHANARLQIEVMFAALIVLMAMALVLYVLVDRLLARLMPWAPETLARAAN